MAPAAASLLPAAAAGSKRPAASDVAEQLAQGDQEAARKNQQPPQLDCPRCGSGNTKFCYYNNYSTTQPRHFCRACRRYWTHGGTLRNVPVGGACRRGGNKRRRLDGSADQPSSSASPPPTSARSEGDSYPDLPPTFPFLSDGAFLPQFDLGGVAPAGLSWPSAVAVPDFYDGLAAPWGGAPLADGVTGAWDEFTGLELSWPPPASN